MISKHPLRILLYSHDSVGLGHLRRTLSVATALIRRGTRVQVLVLSGSPMPDLFELPERTDIVKLPCITKDSNGAYVSRSLPLPIHEIIALRSELIIAAARSFRPDIFLVDHTATGPEKELVAVLRRIEHDGMKTRTVLGIRDIIDTPERARAQMRSQGTLEVLESYYDEILVYGDPRILDVCDAYELPEAARAKTSYVGIACPPKLPARQLEPPVRNGRHLLIHSGGGEDGYELLRGAIAALRGPMRDERLSVTMVAGPMMPGNEARALGRAQQGDSRITVHKTTRDMRTLLEKADLVICMGGYNSVYEALHHHRRLLVMPRIYPRQEQLERSRRLSSLGLLATLPRDVVANPERMAGAILDALNGPPSQNGVHLPFNGADAAAERLLARPRAPEIALGRDHANQD